MMATPNDFEAFVTDQMDETSARAALEHSSVVCSMGPGMPVVYVSDAFKAHTGYSLSDVAGRSLALLQGPRTETEAVAQFRDLISAGDAGTVRITNYRKDGTPFLHECEMRPVRDSDGEVTHFVAIQRIV